MVAQTARVHAAVYQALVGYIKDRAKQFYAWDPVPVGFGDCSYYSPCICDPLDEFNRYINKVPYNPPQTDDYWRQFPGTRYPNLFLYYFNDVDHHTEGGISVGLGASTSITVTANNIYGNVPWDFAASTPHFGGTPRAPGNWSGTTDIAAIQSHITGTLGPPALDFLPIATAPIPGAPMPYTAYFPLVMVGASGG